MSQNLRNASMLRTSSTPLSFGDFSHEESYLNVAKFSLKIERLEFINHYIYIYIYIYIIYTKGSNFN